MSPTTPEPPKARRAARLFDIRLVIALLFVIYGVVLTLMGLNATPEDMDKAAGLNVNLWSGIGMLVFSASLASWAYLRPVRVPDETASERTD